MAPLLTVSRRTLQRWMANERDGLDLAPMAPERPEPDGMTVWNIFPASTGYFGPGPSPFMVNFRVDDLDALLAALREEGCAVDEKVDKSEFGAFGWVMDPEGNRVELWEPPKG